MTLETKFLRLLPPVPLGGTRAPWNSRACGITIKRGRGQMATLECEICGGARWVGEDHPDKPWDGASDREDAWHWGGAGMPCPVCNRAIGQEPPEMPPGYRTLVDTDGAKH